MKLTRRDLGLLAIVIYFTFIGGTFYSQLNFLIRIFNQLLVTIVLGIWLVQRIRHRDGLPATMLDGVLAIWLAISLVSALLGQSLRFSVEEMWFTLIHIIAFYLLVDMMRRHQTDKLTWSFFMASAAVCLVGLTEWLAWYFGFALFDLGWWEIGGWQQPIPPVTHRLAILLNGPTPLAAYLTLFVPIALALILTLPRGSENRVALMIWLPLALLTIGLTYSRAVVLALGVSLPLLFVGWRHLFGGVDIFRWWNERQAVLRWAVIGGSIAVLTVVILFLRQSFTGRVGSTNFRLTLWDAALRIFAENPILGVGPSNFGRALLRFNDPDLPQRQISTAHNVYFNTAAELGLLGLIGGALLFLAITLMWRQAWRAQEEPHERLWLIASGGALLGLAAQTLVDTYPATPNMVVMIALLAFIASRVPVSSTRIRLPVTWLMMALVVGYAVWFGWLSYTDAYSRDVNRQLARDNAAQAVVQANAAVDLDPQLALRHFQQGQANAQLYVDTANPVVLDEAIASYRRGLQLDPQLGIHSANLAALLWEQGDADAAIELLQATAAARSNAQYWFNVGIFYEQQNKWDEAIDAYGQALQLVPSYAGSDYWDLTDDRQARWSAIEQAALEATSTEADRERVQAELWLSRNQPNLVTQQWADDLPLDPSMRRLLAGAYLDQRVPLAALDPLDGIPETSSVWHLRGRAQLLLGNDDMAEQLLRRAIFLGDGTAYGTLGELYEARGDLELAESAYLRGYSPRAVPEDIPVTIYGRFGGFDHVPQLALLASGEQKAASWLNLARLYESQNRIDEAERVYRSLLADDPWLQVAHERLTALE